MDGDAFWWTEFVHDSVVAVDGDLVAEGKVRVACLLAVGFAASASVDIEHGNDTNVVALCSVDVCGRVKAAGDAIESVALATPRAGTVLRSSRLRGRLIARAGAGVPRSGLASTRHYELVSGP